MKPWTVALLALAGCSSVPADKPLPMVPPPTTQQTTLLGVWEKEVSEDLAIFRAIRPSITGPAPALNLYDSATQGLASLSGEPTAKAVDTFRGYVDKPDQARLDALRADKIALDKKTSELELKVSEERDARIRAESDAIQARADKEESDRMASLHESSSQLTRYGTYAIAAGVLALLFGHLIGIQKWVAGLTIGAGVLVASTARPLIDFFGSEKSEYVLICTLAFIAINLAVVIGVKTWRMIKPNETTT